MGVKIQSKGLAKILIIVVIISSFLISVSALNGGLTGRAEPGPYSREDYLKFVDKYVGITEAWSEYQVCNPSDTDFHIQEKSRDYFNWYFNEVEGKLKSSWLEKRINESYTETVDNFKKICNPYESSFENGTVITIDNCTLENSPYQAEKWRWTWKEFNPTGETFKAGECFNFRIHGTYDPAYRDNKIAIDNVVEVAGYNFDEYSWWNASWIYKRRVKINNTQNIQLNDFIVPINISSTTYMMSDCSDLRLLNGSENAEVPFEMESCLQNNVLLWAKVNLTPSTNTSYYVYYGNSTPVVNRSNPSNVWNSSWTAVYHMGATDTSSQLPSSSLKNNATALNGGGGLYQRCFLSNCHGFSGLGSSNEAWEVAASNDVCPTGKVNFTVMMWFYWNDTSNDVYTGAWNSEGGSAGWTFDIESNTVYLLTGGGNTNSKTIQGNKWYFATARWDGTNSCIFINGTSEACTGTWNIITQHKFIIGGLKQSGVLAGDFEGYIDEIRLYNGTVSDAVIKAYYDSMSETYTGVKKFVFFEEVESYVQANETEGRNSIVLGIQDVLGNNTAIYTDQQIYTRNLTNGQKLGRFDKATAYGSQRWAFNYVTTGESFTSMLNMTPALYIWEMGNISAVGIRNSVSNFITQTKQ